MCKSEIGNLATSAKRLLRGDASRVWLYVCDFEPENDDEEDLEIEGPLRAFKTEATARKWCQDEGAQYGDDSYNRLLGNCCDDYLGPASYEVPGSPAKVFVVVGGDRGCTCVFVGAFDNEEEAENLAQECQVKHDEGLSFWASEVDLESDGPGDVYIRPEELPKLDFSDLCKSAMVCKDWNAAIKRALVLLDTLYFPSSPAK